MLELSKKNRQYLVNIYNQLPSSVDFYKLLSDENIKYAVNELLQRKVILIYMSMQRQLEWMFLE